MTQAKASPLDRWEISAAQFPAAGSATEKLSFLLNYALLAPSSHNSQPWYFRLAGDRLELYADRSRVLAVIDPDYRELTISCGAALFCLRLALRYFGYAGTVALCPDADCPDLLARVGLGPAWAPTAQDRRLFAALPGRATHRGAFDDGVLPPQVLAALIDAAWQEHADLCMITDEASRADTAWLIAQADRRQWASRTFREEQAAWMRANESASRDGIPGYALGFSANMSVLAPQLIRTLDLGRSQAPRNVERALGAPALALLWTVADDQRAWLNAGQALARLQLEAAAASVAASFLNQPLEIADLRDQLARRLLPASGYPQLLLRLGYATPDKPTPRRPVTDVLL